MRIEVDFTRLARAAERIGAGTTGWSLGAALLDPRTAIQLELEKGIELDIDSVEINGGDLLTYEDQQILLYIMDHRRYAWKALEQDMGGNRFHVADCKTLKKMRAENRFERYVATNNISGQFRVTGYGRDGEVIDEQTRLYVCQNCLTLLNYRGFRDISWAGRKEFVKRFDIDQFFSTYSSYFDQLPTRRDDAPRQDYSPQWQKVSWEYRKLRNWVCERCEVNLARHRNVLHVHHLDGVRNNDSSENLIALCADCHSRQPGHHHMYVARQTRLLINQLRQQTFKARNETISWERTIELADPAVQGLLMEYRKRHMAIPEVGYEFVLDAEVVAEVELAWSDERLAVSLREDEGTSLMKKYGWKVLSPGQAMAQIDDGDHSI